jgi:isopentenyl-diphosphate delta-isomerase
MGTVEPIAAATSRPVGVEGLLLTVDPDLLAVQGIEPVLDVHLHPGRCHLAVSVQVLERASGRWLLQRRAGTKSLFAGAWANSCCTHPRPTEEPSEAGARRLAEELGLADVPLSHAGSFVYRAVDPVSGMVEHEWDHVFVGLADLAELAPDPAEVAEVSIVDDATLQRILDSRRVAPWVPSVIGLARAFLST